MLSRGRSLVERRDEHAAGIAPDRSPRTMVECAAGWSIRHPLLAILGWFALVLVAVLSTAFVPGHGVRNVDPGEAGRAEQALNAQNGFEPIRESVLVQAREPGGQQFLQDPALRAATEDLVNSLNSTGGSVTDVRSPLGPDGSTLISADGRSGLVTFRVAGTVQELRSNYAAATEAVNGVADRHPDLRVAQAGDRSLSLAVDEGIEDDFHRSETIALPMTLLILVLVFGSLIAAGIPLLLAATSVIATISLLQVIDHWFPINSATSAMVLLIGMAVGVDYALFYLRREREERAAGRSMGEALLVAARTSGRVVVVSGLTVMLCLSGLLLTGIGVFRGLTFGTILVVGLAVIGSMTVLPALLALLGAWVDRARVPWLGKLRTAAARSRFWAGLAQRVVRRPVTWGGLAALALLVTALPAVDMHPQDPAVINSLPRSVPTVDAAIRMQEAFPGSASPSRVVIWNPDGGTADTPAVRAGIEELRASIGGSGGALAEPIAVVPVDEALVVRVPLTGSGTDPGSEAALAKLRDEILPATLGSVDGIDYAVAGRTAVANDFAEKMVARSPYVFAMVLALAFVLLVVAFRSLAIPFISIALNLLSIGAAYGVLTWVFQDGNLTGPLAFTPYGGVVGWLPLFMFVLLFGLSMDYHIFILSRVRERWAAGGDARQAIVGGIGTSAGVVTSAAVIMTAVFAVFVALSAIEYKMLGLGMAFAVFIDATVVRGVLLPAALAILGPRAWSLPRWLQWLPDGFESSPVPVQCMHPTCHRSNPNLQVAGPVVAAGTRHGRGRRDGYRRK